MRRRGARAALTLLTLLLALAPTGARASDPGSCPNPPRHDGSSSCAFALNGLPVVFFGDAQVAGGTANVRVWVTFRGYPQVVLAECTASAPRFASCDRGIPDQSGEPFDLLHQVPRLALICHVEANGPGLYGCKAGLGA